MKRFTSQLEGFWFSGAPAARPAILRLLVGAFAFWYLLPRYSMFVALGRSDPSMFEPVGVASLLPGPIPAGVFQALVIANLIACAAFFLGLWHRYTGPAFAALLLIVLCYRNSWSMIYHNDNVLVLHVLILGLAPAADAISLDGWWRRHRGGRPHLADPRAPDPVEGWRYGWPIRLMCTVTVLTYLICGVAKVAGPLGWSWATGEALRGQVAVDGLRKELLGGGATPMAFALYEHIHLFTVMAAGSLALELGAPLALANRRLGWLWAFATFAMHWGIYSVMGISFRYPLSGVIFASFFPLERIVAGSPSVWRRLRLMPAALRRERHSSSRGPRDLHGPVRVS